MKKIFFFLLLSFNVQSEEFVVIKHEEKLIRFIKTKNYLISAGASSDSFAHDAIKKLKTLQLPSSDIDHRRDLGAIICEKEFKDHLIFGRTKYGDLIALCKFADGTIIDTLGIQNLYLLKTSSY